MRQKVFLGLSFSALTQVFANLTAHFSYYSFPAAYVLCKLCRNCTTLTYMRCHCARELTTRPRTDALAAALITWETTCHFLF